MVEIMAEVIMMCGVSGAGKTTYARQKEQEGYIRLSIDETVWANYGQYGVDYPAEQYESISKKVEAQLREQLLLLLDKNKNVLIDFSFWDRKRRDQYRALIENAGASVKLVYMKADIEVLRKRLRIRNQSIEANSAFEITDELLSKYYNGFEEPAGEGEIIILQQ
ncbi:ATP-binding protein [Eubacteriales bacterium OttesenSCG-928-N13]|nr:ATP-binding protein [Eubacteriales bacterium OttesenSCG-928-N13]